MSFLFSALCQRSTKFYPSMAPANSRVLVLCCASLLSLTWPSLASGQPQDPNYTIRAGDANVAQGSDTTVDIFLDNIGAAVQGWSFGVCHDQSALTLLSVVDSTLTTTSNNGSEPDFNSTDLFPEGFTKAIIICFVGCAVLPPGTSLPLNHATYTAIGSPTATAIEPCSTLGSPVVPVKVIVDSSSINTIRESGTVQIFGGTPPVLLTFHSNTSIGFYDPSDGIGQVTMPITISESLLSSNFPNEISAFSMSMTHNGSLLTTTQVEMGADLQALNGASGPEFYSANILTDQVTLDVLLTVGDQLICDIEREVLLITYIGNPQLLTFNPFGVAPIVEFMDSAISNEVVTAANFTLLDFAEGAATLHPRLRFLRGDANDDGVVQVSDALQIIELVFFGEPVTCHDTADANDDGVLNVADIVRLLDYLFLGSPNLPAPFLACAWDETGSGDCLVYNSCP